MKLTEEEKQIILNKRREEESANPKKTGILKHDLYRALQVTFENIPNGPITYNQFLEAIECNALNKTL